MRNPRVFWGLIIVFLGILLLLQNLGILDINVWTVIWPLILIFLGVQVLIGVAFRRDSPRRELAIPLSNSTEARLTLEYGAGQLKIDGQTPSGLLLSGEFYGGVKESISQSGTSSSVNLKLADEFIWPMGFGDKRTWNIHLSPEIVLDMQIKSGASETELDLTDLLIRSLRLDTGASSTRILAPARAGFTRLDVHSGAASVVVTVPQGVSARIETKGGMSSTSIDRARFPQNGNVYQSPDYPGAPNRIDIQLETGVGSVEII